MILVSAFVLFCLAAGPAAGYPVSGDPWKLKQPDGGLVDVRIWGDEFYQVVESPDGYTLVRDPGSGVICYARLSNDGERLESTGIRAGRDTSPPGGLAPHLRISADARARRVREIRRNRESVGSYGTPGRSSPPVTPSRTTTIGVVTGLLILVDFDDQPATIPRDDVADMFNQPGFSLNGNNGSVRDYYLDVSNGLLDLGHAVTVEYYRAQHPFAHYDDCDAPFHEGVRELFVEALTWMEANGHDFSQHDSDGDGYIDALSLMYAGNTTCGWAQGMWGAASTIYDLWSADGVATGRYQAVPMGPSLGIAASCHELGHMVCGWPDLYDYDHDSEGIGNFCLMKNWESRYNPPEPCAWIKYVSGWGDVTGLSAPAVGLPLPASSTNVMYKFHNPWLSNEYFLIENRQRTGRDALIPDDGLALWHIDTNGSNSWNQQTPEYHYLVTLVQADGRWDLEHNVNEGDDSDLYAAPLFTRITPCSSPHTDWWNGIASGLYIKRISESADTMYFDFALGGEPALAAGTVETVSRTASEWSFRIALEATGPDDAAGVNGTLHVMTAGVTVTDADCYYGIVPTATPTTGDPDGYALNLESWTGEPFDGIVYTTFGGECGGGSYFAILPITLDPPTLVPVVFADLSARSGPGRITIRWDVTADETWRGFNVYRAENGRAALVRLNTGGVLAPSIRAYTDDAVRPGTSYTYTVAAELEDGTEIRSTPVVATTETPAAGLEQNHPNPFASTTRVAYRVDRDTRVGLRVYDVAGRLVRTLHEGVKTAGRYTATWDGRDDNGRTVPSGVYFCRIRAGDFSQSRRMLLVR